MVFCTVSTGNFILNFIFDKYLCVFFCRKWLDCLAYISVSFVWSIEKVGSVWSGTWLSAIWGIHLVTKFTGKIMCHFSKLMDVKIKFTLRIYVCWQSCFWTTKCYITTQTHFCFTLWRYLITEDSILSDTSRKRKNPLKITMLLVYWQCRLINERDMENC